MPIFTLILSGGTLCWAFGSKQTENRIGNRAAGVDTLLCVSASVLVAAAGLCLLPVMPTAGWRGVVGESTARALPQLIVLALAILVERRQGHILWLLAGYAAAVFVIDRILNGAGGHILFAEQLAGLWKKQVTQYNTEVVLSAVGVLAWLRGRKLPACFSILLALASSLMLPLTVFLEKRPNWLALFVSWRPCILPALAVLPLCFPHGKQREQPAPPP